MQFKWQSRNESNWLINVAVFGFAQSNYEVATSGKLKEILCRSRQGSQDRQLRIEQKLKVDVATRDGGRDKRSALKI